MSDVIDEIRENAKPERQAVMTDAQKRTAEKIAVMQAWIDGETIELRTRDKISSRWIPREDSSLWNWIAFDYRVKPKEPREFWLIGVHIFHDEKVAKERSNLWDGQPEVIHVREVI